jgi:hypothetical protein
LNKEKPDAAISDDISATRLSHGDPVGFPPHPRGWFSIVVYQYQRPSCNYSLGSHIPN